MVTTFELVKLSRHVVGMQKELGQEQNITEQFFVEVVPSVGTPYIAGPMEEWVADKLIARLEAQEIAEEMELNFQKMTKGFAFGSMGAMQPAGYLLHST